MTDEKHYQLADFDYDLPEALIAQTPLKQRDASRLLVLDADTGAYQDKHFYDILDYVNPGDAIVMNNSRVLPARLHGVRPETGGHAEVLLLRQDHGDVWETLVRPAKKSPVGSTIVFGDDVTQPIMTATVVGELEHGGRYVEFHYDGIFMALLDKLGEMPLPPYIKEKLHWTPELLNQVRAKGVKTVELTLHVGLGTFRPVEEENIEDHKMHSELYQLSQDAADTLNQVRENGGRIIATGTTSIRTLETIGSKFEGKLQADSGWTDIFIKPGYKWTTVDAFITNFHLPKSTLVMLVAAFTGRDNILNAYQNAVAEQYRFFSFGDAMFIKRDK